MAILFDTSLAESGSPAIEFADGEVLTWKHLVQCVVTDARAIGASAHNTAVLGTSDSLTCLYGLLVGAWLGLVVRIEDGAPEVIEGASKFDEVINDRVESGLLRREGAGDSALKSRELSGQNTNWSIELRTSGSSGKPKKVKISAEALEFQGRAVAERLALTRYDRQLMYMPLNYVYGLSVVLTWIRSGSTLVISKYPVTQASQFFQQLMERDITVFSGVPYTYSLLTRWGLGKLDGTRLRLLTQAGGKLKHRDREALKTVASKIKLVIMYGQTEFGGRIAQSSPCDGAVEPDCVGTLLDGVNVSICEPDEYGYGLVYVSSPSLCENAFELLDCREINGRRYFSTGDYGALIGGKLYISGRNKGFVKLGGQRIPTPAIERLVEDAVPGAECHTYADDGRLECLIIAVFNSKPLPFDTQPEAFRFLVDSAKRNELLLPLLAKVPFKLFVVVGDVPRLANGKTALLEVQSIVKDAKNLEDSIHIWL